MRYAIFTDIHANLEALETVLAKIDELAQEEPIDEIWCLGDVVGYGPNPNECLKIIRERTSVIIAGNHDWAAVGKIDLEDFSEAARISAEWTAKKLTAENRAFLANLPERIEKNECLLVHGSPYGPLWEYLTSEVLAERSFQEFNNRYCFVGHTHVPIIFQQNDAVANTPTRPLDLDIIDEGIDGSETEDGEEGNQDYLPGSEFVTTTNEANTGTTTSEDDKHAEDQQNDHSTHEAIYASRQHKQASAQNQGQAQSAHSASEVEKIQEMVTNAADAVADLQHQIADDVPEIKVATPAELKERIAANESTMVGDQIEDQSEDENQDPYAEDTKEVVFPSEIEQESDIPEHITPEETIQNAEELLNQEIEELLTLLGLSQSMIEVTNEMIVPPEGAWDTPTGYRAIVNPGGIGQPRDGDPRAAFMIYDTRKGFTFYRIAYPFEKTQKKIVEAGLPPYLATRLAYGR